MDHAYDAIVVGAGPAGSSASISLAAHGLDVLLLDKARFPREKVCGDGLSASALAVLDRLGVFAEIEGARPYRIDGVTISAPGGAVAEAKNPKVTGLRDFGYVLPRITLDGILLDRARRAPTVTVVEEADVGGLVRRRGAAVGVRVRVGGHDRELLGKVVIGCDGVHSKIARDLGLLGGDLGSSGSSVRAYFDGVEGIDHAIEIHFQAGVAGYGWIFPTGPTTANVGVGAELRGGGGNIRELFADFVHENPFARQKLARASMAPGSLRGWPLRFDHLPGRRSADNVLLVGDAARFVDPLTGEGIYNALRSGELAARSVATVLRSAGRPEAVGRLYDRLWRREFWLRDNVPGYLMQRALRSRWVVDLAVGRASASPHLSRTLAAAIGHRVPKAMVLAKRWQEDG